MHILDDRSIDVHAYISCCINIHSYFRCSIKAPCLLRKSQIMAFSKSSTSNIGITPRPTQTRFRSQKCVSQFRAPWSQGSRHQAFIQFKLLKMGWNCGQAYCTNSMPSVGRLTPHTTAHAYTLPCLASYGGPSTAESHTQDWPRRRRSHTLRPRTHCQRTSEQIWYIYIYIFIYIWQRLR